LALVVLDPEVIADGQPLLAHRKPLGCGLVGAMAQETHIPTVGRLPSRRFTRTG
jgi:hypothetical protein